jgi:TRAP-type C4-dicarboxylate transport system permease small subunit
MKKIATLFFVFTSLLFILASFQADTALLHLLVAGEVPGTNIVVPASAMLVAYAVCIVAVAMFFIFSYLSMLRKTHTQAKASQLPRRRYAQAI